MAVKRLTKFIRIFRVFCRLRLLKSALSYHYRHLNVFQNVWPSFEYDMTLKAKAILALKKGMPKRGNQFVRTWLSGKDRMQYIYPPLVQDHPNGNPYRYFTTVSWEIAQPLVAPSPI
jgi:hypothetical protein